jgi:hypothetical protein
MVKKKYLAVWNGEGGNTGGSGDWAGFCAPRKGGMIRVLTGGRPVVLILRVDNF